MLKTFCHLHDEEGIFRFYVGGTLGVDMWAAEQLLYLKEQPGYQDIELIVGNGYAKGHADLTLNILRESEEIRALFEKLYV